MPRDIDIEKLARKIRDLTREGKKDQARSLLRKVAGQYGRESAQQVLDAVKKLAAQGRPDPDVEQGGSGSPRPGGASKKATKATPEKSHTDKGSGDFERLLEWAGLSPLLSRQRPPRLHPAFHHRPKKRIGRNWFLNRPDPIFFMRRRIHRHFHFHYPLLWLMDPYSRYFYRRRPPSDHRKIQGLEKDRFREPYAVRPRRIDRRLDRGVTRTLPSRLTGWRESRQPSDHLKEQGIEKNRFRESSSGRPRRIDRRPGKGVSRTLPPRLTGWQRTRQRHLRSHGKGRRRQRKVPRRLFHRAMPGSPQQLLRAFPLVIRRRYRLARDLRRLFANQTRGIQQLLDSLLSGQRPPVIRGRPSFKLRVLRALFVMEIIRAAGTRDARANETPFPIGAAPDSNAAAIRAAWKDAVPTAVKGKPVLPEKSAMGSVLKAVGLGAAATAVLMRPEEAAAADAAAGALDAEAAAQAAAENAGAAQRAADAAKNGADAASEQATEAKAAQEDSQAEVEKAAEEAASAETEADASGDQTADAETLEQAALAEAGETEAAAALADDQAAAATVEAAKTAAAEQTAAAAVEETKAAALLAETEAAATADEAAEATEAAETARAKAQEAAKEAVTAEMAAEKAGIEANAAAQAAQTAEAESLTAAADATGAAEAAEAAAQKAAASAAENTASLATATDAAAQASTAGAVAAAAVDKAKTAAVDDQTAAAAEKIAAAETAAAAKEHAEAVEEGLA